MTDQPKWTKGPWRAVMGSRHVVDVFAGDRDVVSVYGGGVGFEYRDANAHLIAAAPDLYAALEAIRDNEVVRAICPSPLWGKMADAMIKARGETK